MSAQIRISGKDLGELALPNFCPRCFWIKRHVGKPPFQIFPGIFSSIDAYTKSVIHGWFNEHHCPPGWLAGLGDIVDYRNPPHYSKFNLVEPDSNVLLTGAPDAIFVRSDGGSVIADYRTARYTEGQDSLLPIYDMQLNAYALIGEEKGLSPVVDLALIYMEPVTGTEAACQPVNARADGFALSFCATIHRIPLKRDGIAPLLARVREIYELPAAPEGKSGCPDCLAVQKMIDLVR